MELNELKDLIIADCLEFGLKQDQIDRIFSLVSFGKINYGHNDLSFYYDEGRYHLVYFERGHAVNGIVEKTPDDFRYAFQAFHRSRYHFPIDQTKSRREQAKENDEFFMSMMAQKFSHTETYKKALEYYRKIWGEFNIFDYAQK